MYVNIDSFKWDIYQPKGYRLEKIKVKIVRENLSVRGGGDGGSDFFFTRERNDPRKLLFDEKVVIFPEYYRL